MLKNKALVITDDGSEIILLQNGFIGCFCHDLQ